MIDSLRDQLYPSLLVTSIDIFKIPLVSKLNEHEQKLLAFLKLPDIDKDSLWEYARNIIWTYNNFAVNCTIREKPTDALKLFRVALKYLNNKEHNLDWSSREEWRILKIAILRNMGYFYCKFMDYKLAIVQLKEIEKLQLTLNPKTVEIMDTESPILLLSYLSLVASDYEQAEHYAKILINTQKEGSIYKKAEFIEPRLSLKKEEAFKMISNFILGKCYMQNHMYTQALQKYLLGISILKIHDIFQQNFKDQVKTDFIFLKSKTTNPKRPPTSPQAIEIPGGNLFRKNHQIQPQRELKIQGSRSDSNAVFHSPKTRFSFGDIGQSLQPASAKFPSENKPAPIKGFDRYNDKVGNIANIEAEIFKNIKKHTRNTSHGDMQLKKIEPNNFLLPDINYNDPVEKLNSRPQSGTFRRIPTLNLQTESKLESGLSQNSQKSKKSLNNFIDNIENQKVNQINRIVSSSGLASLVEQIENRNPKDRLPQIIDSAKSNLSEVHEFAELVDCLDARDLSDSLIEENKDNSLSLSAVRKKSLQAFSESISSVGENLTSQKDKKVDLPEEKALELTKYHIPHGSGRPKIASGMLSRPSRKNLTISLDTNTVTEDMYTSKDSHNTLTVLGVHSTKFGAPPRVIRAKTSQNAIYISQNNRSDDLDKSSQAQTIPPNTLTQTITSDRNPRNSPNLIHRPNIIAPIEFSPMKRRKRDQKDAKGSFSKFDEKKIPSDSGTETPASKMKIKRSSKKHRPKFKESLDKDGTLSQSNLAKSRSSLQRSKSSTSLKYESKKIPGEIAESSKFKEMRKYTDLKELKNVSLRFYKAFMSKNEIWFFKYNTNSWAFKNKEKKKFILYLELSNTSRRSVELQIPLFCNEKETTENFITVWPIISPSIQNWFKEQNFEEQFIQYESQVLQNIPKRMYRRIEKAMTLYGLRGPNKFTSEDKKSFQEIQKRLIFLIDKKLVEISKANGTALFLTKSSLGERLKIIHKQKTEKKECEKMKIRTLATGQKINVQLPQDVQLYSLEELGQFEKECIEEMNQSKEIRDLVKVQEFKLAKKVFFPDFYSLKRERYSFENILSRQVIFHDVFKIKEFYWIYITCLTTKSLSEHTGDRNIVKTIEICVQPTSADSTFKLSSENKRLYKEFTFSQDEFFKKCADFLSLSYLQAIPTSKMTNAFKLELTKRLSEIISVQGDTIKLSPKFQKIETEDDPFAKASALYRPNEKNSFQEFNFEKSVVSYTHNDYLFNKNFKEIYDKQFINQAQKYFSNKYENNAFVMISNDLEDPNKGLVFKQTYLEDDEVANSNSKNDTEPVETPFLPKEINYSKNRYYFQYRYQNTICYIRLKCDTDLSGKEYVNVSYYHPNREQINYATISNKKLLRRIRTILDKTSSVLQLKSLKNLILYGISSVGRVLHINSTNYDVNQIQKKYAIPVSPAYLKVFMLNQSTSLESAFETWTLYFIHNFEASIGKCYVKLIVYRKKVLVITDNITPEMNTYHFSFEINPEKSKTRLYRLLINSHDLKTYLKLQIEGDSSFYFMKLSRTVLDKFIIWKKLNAKILVLPASNTVHEAAENPGLHLFYNTFNEDTFDTKMRISNNLEPKNYAPKIIYQGTRKFNKNFYVVTIEYVYRFDYWNIHIYNPKTSRHFISVIFFEEILNWKNSFLANIYPSFLNEFKKYQFKDYQEFTKTYKRHFRKVKKKSQLHFTSAIEIPSSKRMMFAPMTRHEVEFLSRKEKQLFFKIDKIYSLPFLRRKQNHSKTLSSRHNADRDERSSQIDFYEFQFWENVVRNLAFSTDQTGRDTIKINNFENRLSELIFSSIIQVDKTVDCLIEIHIENSHETNFIDSSFENITYLSSINNILYIKIFFFNLVICQRENLYLREIINLYIADGLYKYQANYIDSKMNLSDLQNICVYIIHKIRSSNLLTLLNESPLFSKRFSLQQKSDYRNKIKATTLAESDDNLGERKGVFLFRKIINTDPYISASVYYERFRESFMVYLYRFHDCALVAREYKMKEVKKKIPLATNLIDAGLHDVLGKLMIESNENFLKLYASYTYNILEAFKNK